MTNLNESANESREDIPLKSGSKSSSICTCNEYLFEGSKFVTTAFIFLTAVITVALVVQIYYGDFQVVPHGSVATDSRECSEIGTLILKQGGNAVDAAIASAVCLAVVNQHTSGLDASSSILIYNHKTRENAVSIDFDNFGDRSRTLLPKLLVNLARAHQIYGHLEWTKLILPSAELAMQGFFISKQFEQAFRNGKVKKIFKQVVAGEKMVLETLANTLRTVSEIPTEELYNQADYNGKPAQVNVTKATFKDYNLYFPSSQTIGADLLTNLKYIEHLNFTKDDINDIDYVYELANLTQFAYNESEVLTRFHQGTVSNVAVMDTNDLYVSLVIGMYAPFGSQQMTELGYILDIKSSIPYTILPIILTNSNYICAKRIVLGVNDVSTASQIISSWVLGLENTTTVIEYPRFIILNDIGIGFEDDRSTTFNDDVVHKLQNLGTPIHLKEPYSSCNFVEKSADKLNSHSDSRGGGISSRF